jgi:hypothetical protein
MVELAPAALEHQASVIALLAETGLPLDGLEEQFPSAHDHGGWLLREARVRFDAPRGSSERNRGLDRVRASLPGIGYVLGAIQCLIAPRSSFMSTGLVRCC